MKKRIRMQGITVFIGLLLIVFLYDKFFPSWSKEALEEFLDILGIGGILLGFLVRVISRGYKEDYTESGNKLVQNGPYKVMRNPMYFGTLVIGISVVAVLFNFWILAIFIAIYILIYAPQINKEKEKLLKKFGEEYIQYCEKIKPYNLSFRGLKRILSYKIKPAWLKKEIIPLILTILAVILLEIWQDTLLFGQEEIIGEFRETGLILLWWLVFFFILVNKPFNYISSKQKY